MSRTVVLAALAAVALAGIVRIVGRLVAVQRRKRFAARFLTRLRAVDDASDDDAHDWLAQRLGRLNADLGPLAYSARAATPYEPTPVADTPVLKVVLRQIRDARTRADGLATSEDLLLRHAGLLDEARREAILELVNPFRWLGEGMRVVLLSPVFVLRGLGLTRRSTIARIEDTFVFRAFAGLVTIVGLALAVAVLAVGWEAVSETAAALIDRFTVTGDEGSEP